MYGDTDSVLPEIWASFGDPMERRGFADSHISANIAAQIFAMREARGWTQRQLADEAGMAQTRISIMESPSYENFSLSTLKRLAAAFDVALIVRFVSFSELAYWTANLSPDKLAPPGFGSDSLDYVMQQPSLVQFTAPVPYQANAVGAASLNGALVTPGTSAYAGGVVGGNVGLNQTFPSLIESTYLGVGFSGMSVAGLSSAAESAPDLSESSAEAINFSGYLKMMQARGTLQFGVVKT